MVWFGEALPAEAPTTAQRRAASCQLLLSAGTSAQVYPAAGLIETAISAGAKVAEVNPRAAPMSRHVSWTLRGPAAAVLPALAKRAFDTD